jgi:phage FluMu protein gp41
MAKEKKDIKKVDVPEIKPQKDVDVDYAPGQIVVLETGEIAITSEHGFITGIDKNHQPIKALGSIPKPATEEEVQKFNGQYYAEI